MDVILREDVFKLGRAGQVVKVKDGYARNYLIPNQLAYRATESFKRRLAAEHRNRTIRLDALKSDAEAAAAALGQVTLTFKAKSADAEKLFGSITAKDIARELAKVGYEIDKRHIELDEPIRLIGEHAVPIRLHPDVRPEITVKVEREE
jgi:large subunit ribosomal protein L9